MFMLPCIRPLLAPVLFAALLAAACVPGCSPLTKVPIDTISYGTGEAKDARILLVFLHGNGDRNSVFDTEGFVEAVRTRARSVDMISVDAHIGYYMKGTILERLKEDVIGPARARGYDRIWLIGNSLGGFGSLSYAQKYPDEVAGIVLLGPYLGERPMFREIRHGGGLLRWEPGDVILKTKEDAEILVWKWIKEHGQQGQLRADDNDCPKKQECVPRIYLGYGSHDRFTYAQDLLASVLPKEQVIVLDGGHDWSTWRTLWNRFLDRNVFGF